MDSMRHASTRRCAGAAGTYLRCDAHSSQLAHHATDSQEHYVIADGVRGGEKFIIIGPSVAKPHELVGAAIRTLPPVVVEDQSLSFNQKLSHQRAELLRANVGGCDEET